MIKLIFAAVLVLAIACCNAPIVLRNPATGEMAQCQTERSFFGEFGARQATERCAQAYEKAGWERVVP